MRGRDGGRQEEEHREAAEHALRDDRAERGDAEPRIQRRGSASQSQTARMIVRNPTRARDQPMAVLVEDVRRPTSTAGT